MRKVGVVMLTVMMLTLSGCGVQSEAENVGRESTYPEADEVAANLEEAGFDVESLESFEELGLNVSRIKAVNGEDYLDICYEVPSAEDMGRIAEHYRGSYEKYNLMSDDEMICCYSSESVLQSAGLQ